MVSQKQSGLLKHLWICAIQICFKYKKTKLKAFWSNAVLKEILNFSLRYVATSLNVKLSLCSPKLHSCDEFDWISQFSC